MIRFGVVEITGNWKCSTFQVHLDFQQGERNSFSSATPSIEDTVFTRQPTRLPDNIQPADILIHDL